MEQCSPLNIIKWGIDIPNRWEQDKVFDINDSGCFIGTFNKPSQLAEMPPFAVRHDVICESHEEV